MLEPVFLMVASIIFNILANCFPIHFMSKRVYTVYTFRKICYMSIHIHIHRIILLFIFKVAVK